MRVSPRDSPSRTIIRSLRPKRSWSGPSPERTSNGPWFKRAASRSVACCPSCSSCWHWGFEISGVSMSARRILAPSSQNVSPSTTQVFLVEPEHFAISAVTALMPTSAVDVAATGISANVCGRRSCSFLGICSWPPTAPRIVADGCDRASAPAKIAVHANSPSPEPRLILAFLLRDRRSFFLGFRLRICGVSYQPKLRLILPHRLVPCGARSSSRCWAGGLACSGVTGCFAGAT